jgi:hypothetical protein
VYDAALVVYPIIPSFTHSDRSRGQGRDRAGEGRKPWLLCMSFNLGLSSCHRAPELPSTFTDFYLSAPAAPPSAPNPEAARRSWDSSERNHTSVREEKSTGFPLRD